jgi:hypothetical protein
VYRAVWQLNAVPDSIPSCAASYTRIVHAVWYTVWLHHTVSNSTIQSRSAYFILQFTMRYASTIQPAFADVPYISEQCNTRYDWPIQHRVVHHTVWLTRKTLYIVPCSRTTLCCIAQCTIHKDYTIQCCTLSYTVWMHHKPSYISLYEMNTLYIIVQCAIWYECIKQYCAVFHTTSLSARYGMTVPYSIVQYTMHTSMRLFNSKGKVFYQLCCHMVGIITRRI